MFVGVCAISIVAFGQTNRAVSTECSVYASVPLPAEAGQVAAPQIFPACASYRSYGGIGRPQNYSEARACAWQERLAQIGGLTQNPKETTAWIVGGSLILANIYVNGAGVARNVPLAMRFACESEEGMARLAGPEIAKRSASPGTHRLFEFCRFAATTLMMNFCSAYESEVEDARADRYFNSLKRSMTPEQKAAFEMLLSSHKAYIEAHALEVDQGGSIRNVRTAGSQSILKDIFRTHLVHFERQKWPVITNKGIADAGSWLNREYEKKLQQLQARTKEEMDQGAVTARALSSVETTWHAYCDAWVAFARVRYPASAAAIRTAIILDRYRLLKTIR
jgi:uncharacterized protein YecT (DUF1311 family)